MPDAAAFVRWFREIGLRDVALVGGKNASLGELYRELTGTGVRIPNGFAITAEGYRHFMQASGRIGMGAEPAAQARIFCGNPLQFGDGGVIGGDDGVVRIIDLRILRAQRHRPARPERLIRRR